MQTCFIYSAKCSVRGLPVIGLPMLCPILIEPQPHPKNKIVSSEVECVVQSLYIVTSVEILDVYALVGPMDTFDYRHVSKVQGLPVEGLPGLYSFPVDGSTISGELVWQLQLKLSSSTQGVTTIDIHELRVVVESGDGPGITGAGGGSLATTTMLMGDLDLKKSNEMSNTGEIMKTTANGMHAPRSSLGGSNSMRTTGRGMSISDSDANTNSSRKSTIRQPSWASKGGKSSKPASSSSSSSSQGHASTAGKVSRSTALSATAMGRSGGPSPEMVVRGNGGRGRGRGQDGVLVSQSQQQGNALMQQETAAVASVLNAVCEKMVGVVSEKTKAYLSKAGRRTERRVLDKMTKLEQRIEMFDHVLEHATSSSREIERALLALDEDLSSASKPIPVVVVDGAP